MIIWRSTSTVLPLYFKRNNNRQIGATSDDQYETRQLLMLITLKIVRENEYNASLPT